jgi:peptidyl-prolyl cis-trans isomerase SurA
LSRAWLQFSVVGRNLTGEIALLVKPSRGVSRESFGDTFGGTPLRTGLCLLLLSSLLGAAACHRPPSADVVATVNGKEILRSDLDTAYKQSLGDNPPKLSPVEADIRRLQILRGMIDDEILQQRAARLNLTASDEDVNAKLTEIKAPYTEDQFAALLKQQGLTLDELKRNVRRQLTRDKLLNKEIESKINITDAEVRDYYSAHKSDFDLIEPRYHLARIVVAAAPAQAPATADPKKKIEMAHNRLESGDEFGAVAGSFSEDPNTASNGGDMGFVSESQLKGDPAVYDAISKLKPDQFTDVVPITDNGPGHKVTEFDIFKLIARDPAGQRELNDPRVQQTIHQYLHDGQKQALQNAYLEMLQDEAKVRNYFAEQILKQGVPAQ